MSQFMVFVVFCLSFHLVQSHNQEGRVLLSDVKLLTLYKGRQTQARRVTSLPQIKCIAGSAECAYEPDMIQCSNQGSNGIDIQWKCTSQMPKKYRLGKLNVLCEGYNSPEDPYILQGSCGLEYNLELTDKNADDSKLTSSQLMWFNVIALLFCIVIFLWIIVDCGPNNHTPDHRRELVIIDDKMCRKCFTRFFQYSHEPDLYISEIRRSRPETKNICEKCILREYPNKLWEDCILRKYRNGMCTSIQSASYDNDMWTSIQSPSYRNDMCTSIQSASYRNDIYTSVGYGGTKRR